MGQLKRDQFFLSGPMQEVQECLEKKSLCSAVSNNLTRI
jgi:hypothetical protein